MSFSPYIICLSLTQIDLLIEKNVAHLRRLNRYIVMVTSIYFFLCSSCLLSVVSLFFNNGIMSFSLSQSSLCHINNSIEKDNNESLLSHSFSCIFFFFCLSFFSLKRWKDRWTMNIRHHRSSRHLFTIELWISLIFLE